MPVTVWLAAAVVALSLLAAGAASAAAGGNQPYFASLKQERTNVRIGPDSSYPVRWIFKRASIPVEVLYRYGNWRRVRDNSGDGGWVHSAMLSRRRTASIQERHGTDVLMRARPAETARVVAVLKPNVLVAPSSCRDAWCRIEVIGHRMAGYVPQSRLWGVYPDEAF